MASSALETTTPNRRSLGIRTKIVMPMAGVAIVVSILGAAGFHCAQAHQNEGQRRAHVLMLAGSIVRAAESVSDAGQLQRYVAATAYEPGVQSILITAGEPSRVVASSRPGRVGLPTSKLSNADQRLLGVTNATAGEPDQDAMVRRADRGMLECVVPLDVMAENPIASGGSPGALLIRVDGSRIPVAQPMTTGQLLAVLLGTFALLVLAGDLVVQRHVLRPVQSIAEAARRAALGERAARVGSVQADELGQLGARFDEMLDALVQCEESEREAVRLTHQARQDAEAALAEVRCHKSALDQHAIAAQQQQLDVRARLAAFAEHAPAAMAMFDREMRYIAVSHRFIADFRLEGREVLGRHHYDVLPNLPDRWKDVNRRVMAGEVLVCEDDTWYPDPDGEPQHLAWEARPWRTADGQIGGIMICTQDISTLKKAEQDLTRAARLDKLTGLPNRGLFLDRLRHAMARSRRMPERNYAVMFLDFDRFKIINDSLGHTVGDALLVGIAQRLRTHVGDTDSVSSDLAGNTSARLGGDEFVVLLDDIRTPEDAASVAQRLLEALARPYLVGTYEVYSTASIGIVVGDPSYEQAEDVVRDADTAMYESKRLGRCRYTLFDASMRERVQRHLRLESELRKAIGSPQLWLAYQPIVSLSTGAFMSVEALLRWSHPADGPIDPNEFVAIAEESELIITLGEWALREACRQLVRWQQELGALAPRKVSINVSRRQFALPNLPHIIEQVIRQSGIQPWQVQLELTEDSFVSDVQAAVQAMRAIKALGVELAIDDFGTGTSSFASLHEFPVDVLKIDRSMLIGIEDSQNVASLIHGLAVTVKNMGIDMVAEGVETPAQVIALQELGCDFAQGFYFAKPLTADEVHEFATRTLSLTCSTRGAAVYANQWNERLTVYHTLAPADETQ